jgi:hypothetical protein
MDHLSLSNRSGELNSFDVFSMEMAKEKHNVIYEDGNKHSPIRDVGITASVVEPSKLSSIRRSDECSLISSRDPKGQGRGRRSSDHTHVSRQSRPAGSSKTLNDVIAMTILQNERDAEHNHKQPAASANFILKDLEQVDTVWTSEAGSVHSSECETVVHEETESLKHTGDSPSNQVGCVDSKATFKEIGCSTWNLPELRTKESQDVKWCTFTSSDVGNLSWGKSYLEIQSSSSVFGADDPFQFDFDQKFQDEWTTFSNNPFRAKSGSFCDVESCESPSSILDVGFVDRLPSLQTQESWQFFSSKVSV